MTAFDLTGLVVTTSSEYPGFPASNIFDSNLSTRWSATSTALPQWVQAQVTNAQAVTGYTITADGTYPENCPSSWTIEGSNNGTAWTTLDTRSDITFTSGQGRTYTFANSTTYTYYRIHATVMPTPNWCSFSELALDVGGSAVVPTRRATLVASHAAQKASRW